MNPYGITELNLPELYGQVQNARMGRMQLMSVQRQIEAADRAEERDNDIRAVIARGAVGGQGGKGGVSAAYAAPPASGGGNAPYFQSPDTPAQPSQPASQGPANVAMPASAQPAPALSPNIAAELIAIDPQRGAAIAQALRQADEASLARIAAANTEVARLGQHLLTNVPEADWAAEIQRRAPDLLAHGVPQADIEEVVRDPSRRNIMWHVSEARDVEKLIEDARPRPMNVTQGGSLIDTNPNAVDPATGQPRVLYESPTVEVGGVPYARPPSMSALPRPATPEEAARLAPGTRFIDPQGVTRTVPGGAGQQGPRTFR